MTVWVRFDDDNLPFARPGLSFETFSEAANYAKEHKLKIHSITSRPARVVLDGSGFKPHWNNGLGVFIHDRKQYREELKRRNLVEAGNSKPDFSMKPKAKELIDDQLCNYLNTEHKLNDTDINELKKAPVNE